MSATAEDPIAQLAESWGIPLQHGGDTPMGPYLYREQRAMLATDQEALAYAARAMLAFTRARRSDPLIRHVAGSIAAGIPPNRPTDVARALLDWSRRMLRYVPDPLGLELVADPIYTLHSGFGDCDDLGVVLGSLGAAVGLRVAYTYGPMAGGREHVFPLFLLDGAWRPADPTAPGMPLGAWPPGFRIREQLEV